MNTKREKYWSIDSTCFHKSLPMYTYIATFLFVCRMLLKYKCTQKWIKPMGAGDVELNTFTLLFIQFLIFSSFYYYFFFFAIEQDIYSTLHQGNILVTIFMLRVDIKLWWQLGKKKFSANSSFHICIPNIGF